MAGGEHVRRWSYRDFIIVEGAWVKRFGCRQRLEGLCARAPAGEGSQRGSQLPLGDDALAAVGRDIRELGEPVGVGRGRGCHEVQRDRAGEREWLRERRRAPRESLLFLQALVDVRAHAAGADCSASWR